VWTGSGWDSMAGFCEHGNEPASSIKGGKYPEQLSD
jgi:hypothetical protein